MKLLILKENLKTGLNIVEKIASRSPSLPILNNVLLSTEGNFLNLAATDLEIGVRYWVLAKIEKQGKIVVPARFLSGFIGNLPEDKISLEAADNVLHIKAKNFKTQIRGFCADEFPIIPKITDKEYLEIETRDFCQGLSSVYKYASINKTRPEISGIYLSFQKGQIQMVSTDSFRLAEKTLSLEMDSLKPEFQGQNLILPQKTVQELINIGSEEKGRLKIYLSSNQVMFELKEKESARPHLQLISRLIEGEYPDYQEIIPQKYETQIVLKREEFLSHIKTAGLFSGRVNEVKLGVDPKENKLEVFSQSSEIGQNRSLLQGNIKGKSAEISFNWRFLIEGLTTIQSSEVVFELNGEAGPAALKPAGDTSYIYIVMPIKAS